MGYLYSSLLLIFILSCSEKAKDNPTKPNGINQQQPEIITFKQVDSVKFYYFWNKYIRTNDKKYADSIYDNLPDFITDDESYYKYCNIIAINKADSIWKDFLFLEERIIKQDTNSIKLAFKLFSCFWGGAASENLKISLGKLIKVNPELFLKYTKKHFNLVGYDGLSGLVGNFGPEFDNMDMDSLHALKYKLEFTKRIEALNQVENSEYVQLRDSCINILRKTYPSF